MKKYFVLSLFIVMMVFVFSAISFSAEKITFAVVAGMTGDSAGQGIQIKNGANLAVEEINKAGGVNGKQFEFIIGDDQENPNQGVIVAEKFSSNDNLLFVLGHDSSSTNMATLPVWSRVNLPVISPTSTNPKVTKMGFKNFFRLIPHDGIMTSQLVNLAVNKLGYKNLAMIWENSAYGQGMHEVALEVIPGTDAKILGDESFVADVEKDYSSQITKFKGAGVDCVLFLGEYTACGLFLQQSKNLGFNAQVVGASGCSHPKLIEIGGESAEGFIVLSGFDPNDSRPAQAKFIKDFESNFGEKPGEWGAFSYDIPYVVKQAIEMGGDTREKLVEILHSSDFQYNGVTGLTKFDEYGDVTQKEYIYLEVADGKFKSKIIE